MRLLQIVKNPNSVKKGANKMHLSPFLYQTCWIILGPLIRLYLYMRIKQKKEDKYRIKERFGKGYRSVRPEGILIWLHAVSLGECKAAINLVMKLQDMRTDWHFLITTNTITAAEHIKKNCAFMPVTHAFQPLDHPKWVSYFLTYWKPDSAIFLESDFWFNMVTQTKKKQLPLIFASSQISESAKRRWEKNPLIARKLFSSPSLILATDNEQKMYFEQLAGFTEGNSKQKVIVTGSLKSRVSESTSDTAYEEALKEYAKQARCKIILAASTHEYEEDLIAKTVSRLSDVGQFLLIFAPRHPHRAAEIISQLGTMPRRSKGELPQPNNRYFLSDTLGEMTGLYNAADIIILGGSFFSSGGHNPIEPSLTGTPIICGKSIYKNKADYKVLLEAGIIRQVDSTQTLGKTIVETLQTTKALERAINKGQKIAQEACMRPVKASHYIISTIEK